MKHIRQKNTDTYTVVITDGYIDELESHPSITEHPDLFEISEDEIPDNVQYLIYYTE